MYFLQHHPPQLQRALPRRLDDFVDTDHGEIHDLVYVSQFDHLAQYKR